MTYCLGILLPEGLVLASDSRTNAGVDQIATVRKLSILEDPDKAVIALMSAGNLATTQTVVTTLKQAAGTGTPERDLFLHNSMFDVAQTVGNLLRRILERDGAYVERFGDPNGTFLLAGQIRGEPPRLFQVYSAGNFVEATPRNHYLQIGETKYGKPILDRALRFDSSLARAAKLALISFDATIRSNLSVGAPIDVLCYQTDSFSTRNLIKYKNSDPYFLDLKQRYSDGIQATVDAIPEPRLCPDP